MLKNCKGKCWFTHVTQIFLHMTQLTQMFSQYDSCDSNLYPIWLMRLKFISHTAHVLQICYPFDSCDSKLVPKWITFFPPPYDSCDSHLVPKWLIFVTYMTHVNKKNSHYRTHICSPYDSHLFPIWLMWLKFDPYMTDSLVLIWLMWLTFGPHLSCRVTQQISVRQ